MRRRTYISVAELGKDVWPESNRHGELHPDTHRIGEYGGFEDSIIR